MLNFSVHPHPRESSLKYGLVGVIICISNKVQGEALGTGMELGEPVLRGLPAEPALCLSPYLIQLKADGKGGT